MAILQKQDFQKIGWLPIVAAKLHISEEVLIPSHYEFSAEVKEKAAAYDAKHSLLNAKAAAAKRAAFRAEFINECEAKHGKE